MNKIAVNHQHDLPGLKMSNPLSGFLLATAVISLCVALGYLAHLILPHANLSLVFLTGVLIVAARAGLVPALVASVLGFLSFNFFFISPYFTFDVNDDGDVATLLFFFAIAAITGNLAARMHAEVDRNRAMVKQLTDLIKELEAANAQTQREQLRSALLSSVSHDLRTPLSSIIGSTSSLIEYGADISRHNQEELLRTILDEAERLNRYIQNLLDMTRLGSGSVKPKRDWTDIGDVISSALERLHANDRNVNIDVEVDPKMPLIYVQGVLVEQALHNVVDNALRYSPPESLVSIRVRRDGDWAVIDVLDQGPGIPEADRQRVFDMFFTDEGRDMRSGSGLGLAICSGVIKAHGGEVKATSNPDGPGACIQIRLPLTKQEASYAG